VFLTVSSSDSGKYLVVMSKLVKISQRFSNNLLIISSCSALLLFNIESPLIISVTLRAALKHFFTQVIIVSTDSLNS
jgi:hypothetical protein